ncbi:MAG: oxidoreductase activity containing protein, partial [Marteilia pararefringens]
MLLIAIVLLHNCFINAIEKDEQSYYCKDAPFYKVDEKDIGSKFGISKKEIADYANKIKEILEENILKVSNINAFLTNKLSHKSQERCFESLNRCSYLNLSIPINKESYTGFGGEKAHEAWRKLHYEAGKLRVSNDLLSKLVKGIHLNVSTHICKRYFYDHKKQTCSENIKEFSRRFIPDRGSDFDQEYFDDFLSYFMIYTATLRRYIQQSTTLSDVWKKLSINAQSDQLLVQRTIDLMLQLPNYKVPISLVDPAQLAMHKDDIDRMFRKIERIIEEDVTCGKCNAFANIQITALRAITRLIEFFHCSAADGTCGV